MSPSLSNAGDLFPRCAFCFHVIEQHAHHPDEGVSAPCLACYCLDYRTEQVHADEDIRLIEEQLGYPVNLEQLGRAAERILVAPEGCWTMMEQILARALLRVIQECEARSPAPPP